MPIVQSSTTLMDMPANWWPKPSGGLRLYDQYAYDYATIYRTQPNVRTCVEFLARNVAQLGLHVYRRVSQTDRQRLTDHPLAQVLSRPLPAEYKVTRYRLIESLVSDLGIYANAYWLKIRVEGAPAGLLRVPPWMVTVYGKLTPVRYEVNLGDGPPRKFVADEVVHLRGYNPDSGALGVSPLETLRRILAEEHAMGDYREHYWRNSARMNGLIRRPASAPAWSDAARGRFKAEFEALYGGAENSGRTAILEEDMEWVATQFNAQESEYLGARKLGREECARTYHIPPPLVGILDHATFSNIREQHKSLYSDTLGPWLAMIEQDVQLQLLPEFEDTDGVYCEFNIAEKLQGDFEEQTKALQSAVGRPWMTANEARGVMNLPALDGDAAGLVTPLNVLTGGQASPRDSGKLRIENRELKIAAEQKGFGVQAPELRSRHEAKWVEVLARHYRRQEAAIVSRVPEAIQQPQQIQAPGKAYIGQVWFDEDRWNRELFEDLYKLNVLTASTWGRMVLETMVLDDEFDYDQFDEAMLPWLSEHARIQAEYFNERMRSELEQAMADQDPRGAVKSVFVAALTVWAAQQAESAVTSALNFGATEGATAGSARTKTWRVRSNNPRDSHAALDGVTVGIRETFPNGLRWPGDPRGTADDNARCQCEVEFN